jgi:flagellar hook-length control protein FliK
MTPTAAVVRAEATAPVFSLSAEPTATAAVTGGEGVGDASPVSTGITAAESAQNVHSVVRSMRMQFLGGGGAAVLRLDPEHLGPVTLTVRVEQGRVAAHIQAETADASRWIETHQDELRSALEGQGLEVKELVVSTDPEGRREREQPRDPFRPRARRRSDDGATLPTFEVVA